MLENARASLVQSSQTLLSPANSPQLSFPLWRHPQHWFLLREFCCSWDRQISTALGHLWSHYASGNVKCDPLDEVIWQQYLGHSIDHTLPFRNHIFVTHYKRKDSKMQKAFDIQRYSVKHCLTLKTHNCQNNREITKSISTSSIN